MDLKLLTCEAAEAKSLKSKSQDWDEMKKKTHSSPLYLTLHLWYALFII